MSTNGKTSGFQLPTSPQMWKLKKTSKIKDWSDQLEAKNNLASAVGFPWHIQWLKELNFSLLIFFVIQMTAWMLSIPQYKYCSQFTAEFCLLLQEVTPLGYKYCLGGSLNTSYEYVTKLWKWPFWIRCICLFQMPSLLWKSTTPI